MWSIIYACSIMYLFTSCKYHKSPRESLWESIIWEKSRREIAEWKLSHTYKYLHELQMWPHLSECFHAFTFENICMDLRENQDLQLVRPVWKTCENCTKGKICSRFYHITTTTSRIPHIMRFAIYSIKFANESLVTLCRVTE